VPTEQKPQITPPAVPEAQETQVTPANVPAEQKPQITPPAVPAEQQQTKETYQPLATISDTPSQDSPAPQGFDLWEACKEDITPNALYRHAFRMTQTEQNTPLFENPESFVQLIQNLTNPPKAYIFQIERGQQTGKLHYQGFIKLASKKRSDQLGSGPVLNQLAHGIQFLPASNESALIKYCRKEETRVMGPWSFPSDLLGRRS
jgi:ATP-dependent exoDNAse (exonuclease V) beta subunit